MWNTAISTCAKAHQCHRALRLLEGMRPAGVERNVDTYNIAISACSKAGDVTEVVRLFKKMGDSGVAPNVDTYNAAISAFEKVGDEPQVHRLLKDMKSVGVEPDEETWYAATGHSWFQAFSWLSNVGVGRCAEWPGLYSVTVSLCAEAGRWQHALHLIMEVHRDGVEPEEKTWSATISACCRAGVSQPAVWRLKEMPQAGVEPDFARWQWHGISAWEQAGEPGERAPALAQLGLCPFPRFWCQR